MVEINIEKELENGMNDLSENWIILLETNVENALEVSMKSVKFFLERGMSAVVLSSNRPYTNLLDIYKKNNIDTEKVIILDGVSRGKNSGKNKNVVFLDNLNDLTDISIILNETLQKLKGKRSFLLIDSITSMLIYNDPRVFAKFIHSVLVKMRINNESGILFSLEDETKKEIRAEIAQLCDRVIKIGK